MKNVDKRKLFGTIIGGIAFIFCMIFFTYAWYLWRSNNTNITSSIIDEIPVEIEFENNGNIIENNIGPVLNIDDEISSVFKANNKSTKPKHLYIALKINSIDSELLADNFKYMIVKSTELPSTDEEIDESTLIYDYNNPLATGNFENFTIATNSLGEDIIDGETIIFYKVIIYLDGSTKTDLNQQGKSINATLIISDAPVKYLNEVEPGSYVKYVGNNGCPEGHCNGTNANYVSDSNMGYCAREKHEFTVNGWRVGYIKDGYAHLISAGAPECMTTTSDGTTTNATTITNFEQTEGVPLHIANLNNKALTYCNSEYTANGKCDSTTAWSMAENDYIKMAGHDFAYCRSLDTKNTSIPCVTNNNLIINGSTYWFANPSETTIWTDTEPVDYFGAYYWDNDRYYTARYPLNYSRGIRPVIKLAENVIVASGAGTYEDPYILTKAGINATNHIKNLYKKGEESDYTTVHIGGDTSKPTVTLNTKESIMLDNNGEYRYYGANPNNYVEFNGELWRIISSSKVFSSSTDTTGNQRLRIIKSESIGKHSWDYNNINNWENATLNITLNGIYYNRASGSCYLDGASTTCDYENGDIKGLSDKARNLIDNSLWYLGGNNDSDLYVDDYYTFERGTTVPTEGYPTSTVAKLGIMYPSDYAYAADLSKCTKTGYSYSEDTTNCLNTDWLYNSTYQWVISPYSGDLLRAFDVDEAGYVGYGGDGSFPYEVRPVVVLKSNVLITGGDGSSGNPYKLTINK